MLSHRRGKNRVLESVCTAVPLVARSPAFWVAVTQTIVCCCFQLYLTSDHRTLMKSSVKSWLQEVTLTDEVTHLNCWQAAFLDPQLRLEYEGFPVRVSLACGTLGPGVCARKGCGSQLPVKQRLTVAPTASRLCLFLSFITQMWITPV